MMMCRYYHEPDKKDQPFVFKVPISDLATMEELHSRLSALLQEMGTQPAEKQLVLVYLYRIPFVLLPSCFADTSNGPWQPNGIRRMHGSQSTLTMFSHTLTRAMMHFRARI